VGQPTARIVRDEEGQLPKLAAELGDVDAATWVHFHCHGGAGRWQAPLSEVRWRRLEEFRRYAFEGYTLGLPWPGFAK